MCHGYHSYVRLRYISFQTVGGKKILAVSSTQPGQCLIPNRSGFNVNFPFPYAPCMDYLPTFALKSQVNIPYMEHMRFMAGIPNNSNDLCYPPAIKRGLLAHTSIQFDDFPTEPNIHVIFQRVPSGYLTQLWKITMSKCGNSS